MSIAIPAPDDEGRSFPGWGTLAGALALYAACVAAATYPLVANFRSAVPGSTADPMHVLWAMRWYMACLLEGRAPFLCPEIQYPVGAPLGFFDPVRLQALLYIPLWSLLHDDTICYNVLFFLAFLSTGLGTFLLAWQVVRDRACAGLAGLLAMLGTPMMIHSFGHLVLIQLGGFPLFLIAWMRFVDRPGRGRLAGAVAAYLLLAMSAHYFVVLGVFPACLYVAWRWGRAWLSGSRTWLRERAGWLLGFAMLTAPCLAAIFSTHLWVIAHGYSMERPVWQFDSFGAPLWGYLAPLPWHRIDGALPLNVYRAVGMKQAACECASYLGVVTLGLLLYAAVNRVRFARASYWWSLFAMLVILSLGGHATIGAHRIDLPARFFREHFAAFRLLRVPARFNLFASVAAAVLAAAGLKHLLGRLPRRWMRAAVCGVLFVVAFLDLAPAGPYPTYALPSMPACYEALTQSDPGASFLDAPLLRSGRSNEQTAAYAYWQTFHGARTSGGYSAHANAEFDEMVVAFSPFASARLADPDYLKDPSAETFSFAEGVRFEDYLWLYLSAHRFDYVVLHKRPMRAYPHHLSRFAALLRDAKVYEDGATTAYALARMAPPSRPVALCTRGWLEKCVSRGHRACRLAETARLVAYNTEPGRDLSLALDAASTLGPCTVRLRRGDDELARWVVRPGDFATHRSGPFRLPRVSTS